MPDMNTFQLPDPLPTGTDELRTLEQEAAAAFEARYDAGASSPEDLAELQALAEQVRVVREAIVASETGEPVEPEQPGEPVEPVEPAPAEPEQPTEPAEPVETAPSAAGAVLDALLLTPRPEATAPEPEVLVPDAVVPPPQPIQQVAAPQPAPTSMAAAVVEALPDTEMAVARPDPVTIVASADIPGIPAASEINGMAGLVSAIGAKARSLPVLAGSRYPVASIQKPLHPDRNLDGLSERDQMERMNDLSSVDVLVASGGWCAPSETIYDFACEVEAPPDAVNLPTFTTRRGGVRYPVSPTYADFKNLTNNGLFTWTEADDIAAATQPGGPEKPCFKIPCVTFTECRLELEGLCVTAGNLTDLAYPELIRRYMSLVLTAHLHRMNTQKILKMLATVDDTVVLAATFAAASAVLAGIELQVQDLRDQFSLSKNSVVEAMAPRWLSGVIRADIARRECCSLDAVTDAEIQSYLRGAGIQLQFVSDWQELGDPAAPALVWPTTVDILLWLPGSYRELTGPSLDIAVARDSVQNATNDHTVAFTEESYQVCKPGCGSRLVTIPICPNGSSGERTAMDCAVV
jgi:hypothetical protein